MRRAKGCEEWARKSYRPFKNQPSSTNQAAGSLVLVSESLAEPSTVFDSTTNASKDNRNS